MEQTRSLLQEMAEKSEDYARSSVEVIKLRVVKATADMAGAFIAQVVLLVVLSSCLLLLNVGISLYIGDCIGNMAFGFLIVSGFYLFVAILVFFFLRNIIEAPVSRYVINKMLNRTK